tara:strand:+ start:713 stop:1111 length:399 start_codon:yes stop_codon:yes gene_type:complete
MSSSATPVALMIDEEVKRLTEALERAASLIKILDQRGEVKKLEEEIKKHKKGREAATMENSKLWGENKELKGYQKQVKIYLSRAEEKNKELNQFALAVHNFAYGTEWDDEDIVSAMDFDGIIEKMKNDEKGE